LSITQAHRISGLLVVAAVAAAGFVGPASSATAIPPPVPRVALDFDGDGSADLALWNPETGRWRFAEVCDIHPDTGCGFSHGHVTDVSGRVAAAAGDFDGDGVADPAVFDRITGTWRIVPLHEPAITTAFGEPGDIPVPADYDGDGVADLAVFRPASGDFVISSLSGPNTVKFDAVGDVPVPADYDGDGRADPAQFRRADGTWWVRTSTSGKLVAHSFGSPEDIPVPADYDGDLQADLAVYRPGTGLWRIRSSGHSLGERFVLWGSPGDVPVPADYDGDGRADIAVYHPIPAADAGVAVPRTGWWIYPAPGPIQFGEPNEEPVGAPPAIAS